MSYENYKQRMKKRNENLISYHSKHPGIKQEDLAKIFKISQSRISRILGREQ